ncbi:MAG: hypothetical protein MK052_00175 [Alphaproteobacteria bacterium]|nr:hypothetical protein [Alphaproteobacteria bacterium]
MDQPYIDIIVEGILSTTLWSFTTDTTFFAMVAFGNSDIQLALLCAVLGGSIGASINYGLGRLLAILQTNGTSKIPQDKYDLWRKRAYFAAPIICMLSWIHLVGALVFALGFLRVRAFLVIPFLMIGQALYYGYAIMYT